MHHIFEEAFAKKTRDEWAKIFMGGDGCVTPVLSMKEAPHFEHNVRRVRTVGGGHSSSSASLRV